MIIHSYKELIVWQRSIELVVAIYELTEKFPKEEIYGLISQMNDPLFLSRQILLKEDIENQSGLFAVLRIAYGSEQSLKRKLK